ncbi:MAG: divergent polysaccharide deacetylase family protein [Clostridiales bacterium]|nr:divergent polysaccharide deacetylase family protein [Clostridiales bacterium]
MKKIALLIAAALLSRQLAVRADEPPKPDEPKTAYLAIVIDDFGNNCAGTEEMLKLPIPITAAVMPNMPSSTKDAEDFHAAGKCVILHMPMQSDTGKISWLGPSPVTLDLDAEQVKSLVSSALDQLKFAEGMNNHMGSTITKSEPILLHIMDVLKERDLICLDSLTTANSKVGVAAEKKGVKYLARDVFLDGTQDPNEIAKNIKKAASVAKKNGFAIAIGHVGPWGGIPTANALASLVPSLQAEGIEFLTLTELYQRLHESLSPL